MNFKKRILGIDFSVKEIWIYGNVHGMYKKIFTTYRKFYILLIPIITISKQIIEVERGYEMAMMGGKPYRNKK